MSHVATDAIFVATYESSIEALGLHVAIDGLYVATYDSSTTTYASYIKTLYTYDIISNL